MTKQIQKSEWQDRLQALTSGNRNRIASISFKGNILAENKPFDSINYDPAGKGNDMVIAVEGFTHTIDLPVELYLAHDEQGVVTSLEVVDQKGQACHLKFY